MRTRVRYPGLRDDVHAFLFQPNQPNGGGVLVQHQHASQFHLGKSEVAGLVGDALHAFGPALMTQGWTVLAPDAPGFEDRRPGRPGTSRQPEDWTHYYNLMAHRLVSGELLLTEAIADLEVAVGVLASCSTVGASNIGFLGHSYGGNLGQWMAALDPRLRFACVSGSTGSYRAKLARQTALEFSLVIPGIVQGFDIEDLIRLARPKPMLVVAGEDDPQAADAQDVVARAGPWAELQLRVVPGGHALDHVRQRIILDWFTLRY